MEREYKRGNMEDLSIIFSKCLSAHKQEREEGERTLKSYESQENYPLVLLQYLSSGAPPHYLQSAAVALKNYVKSCWAPDEGFSATPQVKDSLRQVIFERMVNSDNKIANLLRETIAQMAVSDFPNEWPGLLNSFGQGLSAGYLQNPKVVFETLRTAHKIFKHYRYDFRSDELWLEIKQVVEKLFGPFSAVGQQMVSSLQSGSGDLKGHLQALLPFLEVFMSLNAQDIPQSFDDTLQEWMRIFGFLMEFTHPSLTSPQDQELLFQMKGKVLKSLNLYAQKYDEDFEPYQENFCKIVWDMLSKTAGRSEYERFVSASLDFFRVMFPKPAIAQLMFPNLNLFFSTLVLPNMVISEEELDMAESAPMDFVKTFLEDANEETRRCACNQLMKVLIRQFPAEVQNLINQQQSFVINSFTTNPSEGWKLMDAFILLISGTYPLFYTSKNGATKVHVPHEHILDLYNRLVAPQLGDQRYPVLKTSCLKFVYVYRNQLLPSSLLPIFNQVTAFLDSTNPLLATYAAATLERMLMVKQSERDLVFSKDTISPSLQGILEGIANALNKHPKNLYIIKAFFRVIWLSQDAFAPYVSPACDIFIEYLKQVMSSPIDSDPLFYWYMFECFALLAKNARNEVFAQVNAKIEPYMALIIQRSHPELLPYAFQMQALFIKLQRALSPTNSQILESVLPLRNWEAGSKYYAPTLVLFLESTMAAAPEKLSHHINDLAAIMYQLFQLALDGQAFSLLTKCIETYPLENLRDIFRELYRIMFTKLHNAKEKNIRLGPLFHKGFIMYTSSFILMHGAQALSDSMDSVQSGIFAMVLKSVFVQNLRVLDSQQDRKVAAAAITSALSLPMPQDIWAEVFGSALKMLEVQTNLASGNIYSNGLIDLPEENSLHMTRDAYQKIFSLEDLPVDKLQNIPDIKQYFVKTVLAYNFPGSFLNYVGGFLDERSQQILTMYSQAYGVPLY